ncbi:hypothetical protein RSSM_01188 [Rhodopirellula sallentina SM41]|uniref:Uncharacterized protein n=1 Tax=Rhodopirellula sallentina SM41 TaxID=1263870 RepID=M5U787_9BACT|nr:hypothetical protein RSSM_01188 [Rhodopirellula sallentina SM41]
MHHRLAIAKPNAAEMPRIKNMVNASAAVAVWEAAGETRLVSP